MHRLAIGLTGVMLFSALGMVSDGHASWAKEVATDYAQDKKTYALEATTYHVQSWSENYACQDTSSWSCYQTQKIGETADVGWRIIAVVSGILFFIKVAEPVSELF